MKRKAKLSKADAKRIAKLLADVALDKKQFVNDIIRATPPDVFQDKIKINREQRVIAVMCPLVSVADPTKSCGETFPLKKRGDRSTYNFAKWDRHLAEVHGLKMPSPVDVLGYGNEAH